MQCYKHSMPRQLTNKQRSCNPYSNSPGKSRQQATVLARVSVTSLAQTQQKDLTADVLQTAIKLALQSRLRKFQGIDVKVWSTALGLLEGKFGGMTVQGKRWQTPLDLTAETVEVSVGEMQVDTGALVMQQRVTLKNVPAGGCGFVLTATDLGNFMVHPLMKQAAAKAIQGQPFYFDRSTVDIGTGADGRGYVTYHGVWAGDGQCYSVSMTPVMLSKVPKIEVTAKLVPTEVPVTPLPCDPPAPSDPTATSVASASSVSSTDADQLITNIIASREALVSAELSHFFSNLTLNLQGIEIGSPNLTVFPPGANQEAANKRDHLLEISMKLRILEMPPLNMKF